MPTKPTFKREVVEPFLKKYPAHSTRGLVSLIWDET